MGYGSLVLARPLRHRIDEGVPAGTAIGRDAQQATGPGNVTDAPDQLPPESQIPHPLTDTTTGKLLNHPANLGAIYEGLAAFLGEPVEALSVRVEENFLRLFGRIDWARA